MFDQIDIAVNDEGGFAVVSSRALPLLPLLPLPLLAAEGVCGDGGTTF
jgi:hypothetical protein